jgi:O-antigen/teichoic acid export membrane protein
VTDSRLLARNTALNVAGQAVPLVAALVAIPWLIRGLGADRFGVLTLAWAAIGYFGLVDLGLGRALTHAVATRLGSDREDELVALGWTALALMFLLGAVGAAALAAATPWLVTDLLKIPSSLTGESARSFYLLALSLPIVVSTAGLRGIIEAHQHFGLATMLRIPLAIFSYAGPLAALPFTHRLDIVVAVLVLGRVVTWLAHFVLCVNRYAFLRHRVTIRRHVIWPLLRVGGWMTVSNVVSPLMTYFDRFLIGALLPVAAVAYYVTPFEAVMKLSLFPSALMGVFFPAFAESFARDRARTAQLFDQGVRAVVLVIFPVSLVLVTLASEILRVWVGAEFSRAGSPVLQWLAVGVLINSVGYVGFGVLQAMGRADLTGKLNLVELPLYVATIWLLTTTLGLAGVAMAWTLRVFVDTVALWMMARRNLATERRLLRTPMMTWLTMALALAVGALLPGTTARIAYVFAAGAVYLPVAWFGLITPSERQAVRRIMRRSVSTIDDPSRQAA